ncbi:hypothetical protein P409_02800 [Inquilinus limosus MP06]|uniref:Uncharacterized protein n=2 Tax=Inquilinus limosus TaxID=171674 RepID=A0A0A0DAI2_9PROT|nr:hypothetical protein P409_02800 [Inquilinus limosus MP06]
MAISTLLAAKQTYANDRAMFEAERAEREQERRERRADEERRRSEERAKQEAERRSSMRITAFAAIAEINDALPGIDANLTNLLQRAKAASEGRTIMFSPTEVIFPDLRCLAGAEHMFEFGEDVGKQTIDLALQINRYNRAISLLAHSIDGGNASWIGAQLEPIRNDLLSWRDTVAERSGVDGRS